VRIIRFSSMPVDPENLQKYNDEWKSGFDAIEAKFKPDMLVVHQEAEKLEQALQEKYVQIALATLPKSQKQWVELLNKFDAPIMIAKSSENPKELVLVIMDQQLG